MNSGDSTIISVKESHFKKNIIKPIINSSPQQINIAKLKIESYNLEKELYKFISNELHITENNDTQILLYNLKGASYNNYKSDYDKICEFANSININDRLALLNGKMYCINCDCICVNPCIICGYSDNNNPNKAINMKLKYILDSSNNINNNDFLYKPSKYNLLGFSNNPPNVLNNYDEDIYNYLNYEFDTKNYDLDIKDYDIVKIYDKIDSNDTFKFSKYQSKYIKTDKVDESNLNNDESNKSELSEINFSEMSNSKFEKLSLNDKKKYILYLKNKLNIVNKSLK